VDKNYQLTSMMKMNKLSIAVAAGVLGTAAFGGAAHGQSADALLDKLVEKGVLTVKEATDLRQQADDDFTKAYQAKTGMPDWVTSLKFNGDFRGRFEQNNAENTALITRNRYRYRLRFGTTASLENDFEVGFRLASGNPQTNPGGTLVGGQPITANQDLNSLSSRKFIWIDAAYAKWTPIHTADWTFSATFGKMDNPFALSNMIFDYDIDPEGGAIQMSYNLSSQHALKFNSAAFVLDEINQNNTATPTAVGGSRDPYMYGGQLLLESKWTPKIESSVGVAVFDIGNKQGLSDKIQELYNVGNTRDANGFLRYNMNPVIGTGALTYKLDSMPFYDGAFPIKASGEYMVNPGAPVNNMAYRAGFTLGKAGQKHLWEINYRYQYLEADSWFDALEDDDNGAFYATGVPANSQLNGTGKANGWFGGTNIKGHLIQGTYSFTDFLNFTFTYYLNDLIIATKGQNGAAGHFMCDFMWKF
jgi:hypothetical protein